MPKLILCRGLPASGKSTWALQQLKQYPGQYKRINRDLLREMLDGGEHNRHNEANIVDAEYELAELFLLRGYDVIIDDTNLKKETLDLWKRFMEHMGDSCTLEIEDFTHVPLEECLKRNRERKDKKPIPEQDIINMHKHLLVPPYTVMHEGKAAFTNFGTIEQIKARLQAAKEE